MTIKKDSYRPLFCRAAFPGMIGGLAALLLMFAPMGFASALLGYDSLDDEELAQLAAGAVVSDVWRDKSRNDGAIDAFAAVEISASAQQVWAVMTSCEKTLEVVREMKSCRVLETAPDSSWDMREQIFSAPFPVPNLRTVFRTDFTPFQNIKITGAGGDMKIQEGLWQITPLTGAAHDMPRVRVTYRATVQPKFPLPRLLLRRAVRKDTPALMTALRDVTQALNHVPEISAAAHKDNALHNSD